MEDLSSCEEENLPAISFKKLKKTRNGLAPSAEVLRANVPSVNNQDIDWNQWISASSTRNYLIKDPLLDWLSYHSANLVVKKPQYATNIVKAISAPKRDNFTEFIMFQGCEFETQVMTYLYKKHGKDVIVDVGGNLNARSIEKANETIDLMNKGVPIIYQGVLHNHQNQTYGVPDLIVRSDWINLLVKDRVLSKGDECQSAPNLKGNVDKKLGSSTRGEPDYHYRIVDIKFTTLSLRADQTHLLNSGSIPAYKGQLYIYNTALGVIQGYTPKEAYLLGRKWKYTSKGVAYKGKACDEKLGVVDFNDIDIEYIQKTEEALSWIRDMRQNGANWSVGPDLPLCRKELYPNMSNLYDYPWRSVKQKIANDIKEITSLWMCGVKNRESAMAYGIYQWTDPRCNPYTLGVFGPKTKRVLKRILDINRPRTDQVEGDENIISPDVSPAIIENNDEGWQIKQNIEFYVDFEFINEVVSDLKRVPKAETRSIIFMIGVGYFDMITGVWKYRDFTVEELTEEAEYHICSEFSKYIRAESEWWECENPLLIHWSNAENWQWEHASKRHAFSRPNLWIPSKRASLEEGSTHDTEPRWFDLLQVFRSEPIVIKGCLGFGLKEVAKTLSNLGYIGQVWDNDSSCTDGAGAMLSAYKAYKDAEKKRLCIKESPLIKDIIKYNEIDCKVVGNIINYLRQFHVYRPVLESTEQTETPKDFMMYEGGGFESDEEDDEDSSSVIIYDI